MRELRCWRCGVPADVDWIDVRTFGTQGTDAIPGAVQCVTADFPG